MPPPPPASTPLVSVIVPIHDLRAQVGAAIASLRAQSFGNFEAIIVDDGSRDGSDRAACAAIDGDPRFQLIRFDNRGLSAARNAGLDRARGQYLAFLDGDDRWSGSFLARMITFIEAERADWVACAFRDIHPAGPGRIHSAIHGLTHDQLLDQAPGPTRWPLNDWRAIIRHYPSVWNKLYRRDFVARLRFDEDTWFEDHAFFLQLAARSATLPHLPEPLYLQTRGRPGQITGRDDERIFQQFDVLERIERIMAAHPLPGAPEAMAEMTGRLLAERSLALREPVRRARWLARTARHLQARDMTLPPDQSASLAATLAGRIAVTVLLEPAPPMRAPRPLPDDRLRKTIATLAEQDISSLEVIVLLPPGQGPPDLSPLQQAGRAACILDVPRPGPAAWGAGADHAQGAALLIARADDTFEPSALRLLADARGRQGTPMACCGYISPAGRWRTGWNGMLQGDQARLHDGIVIHSPPGCQPRMPLLASHMIAREQLQTALRAPGLDDMGDLAEEALLDRLGAQGISNVWLDFPGLTATARPLPRPGDIARALARFRPERRQCEVLSRLVQLRLDLAQGLPRPRRLAWIVQLALRRRAGCRTAMARSTPSWIRASAASLRFAHPAGATDEAPQPANPDRGIRMIPFMARPGNRLSLAFEDTGLWEILLDFHTADRLRIPLRITLCPRGGQVWLARRDAGGWRRAHGHPWTFGPPPWKLDLEFGRFFLDLRLEGRPLARLDPLWRLDRGGRMFLRRGFAGLGRIRGFTSNAHIALDPGIRRMALAAPMDTAPARLLLDDNLVVLAPAGSERLRLAGGQMLDLVAPPAGGTPRLALPGRVWRGIPADAPLRMMAEPGGTELVLSRQDLAHRITRAAQGDLAGNQFLLLQILDHLAHAGIAADLDGDTARALRAGARTLGLGALLPPDLVSPPPPAPADDWYQDIAIAQAHFEAELRDRGLPPTPDILARRLRVIADLKARTWSFMGLVELACHEDRMQLLFDTAPLARVDPTGLDSQDAWTISTRMPFDARQPDGAGLVLAALRRLLATPEGWLSTPPLVWAVQHVAASPTPTPEDAARTRPARTALIEQLTTLWSDLILREAARPTGRSSCHAVIGCSLRLMLHPDLSETARDRIARAVIRAHALDPLLVDLLGEAPVPARLRARLGPVIQACRLVHRTDTPPADLRKALAMLVQHGAIEAGRAARMLLGPAGTMALDRPPKEDDLIEMGQDPGEAVIRLACFPDDDLHRPDGTGLLPHAATAIARLWRGVPPAPHEGLARDLGRGLQQLFEILRETSPPDLILLEPLLENVLGDLHRLSGPRGDWLGEAAGLALCLECMRAGAAPLAIRLLDRLELLAAAHPADTLDTRRTAPALAGLHAKFRGPDEVMTRARAILGIPDSAPDTRRHHPIETAANPLHDLLVIVYSCKASLHERIPALRTGWLAALERFGVPYLVVVGGAGPELAGRVVGDVLHLDCPDDYEGLPRKTLAMVGWVLENTGFARIHKIDDDCFIDVEGLLEGLGHLRHDYWGRHLRMAPGQLGRTWHQAKAASERGRHEIDRSPEPSEYADGGAGYLLSRRAMAALMRAAASPEGRWLISLSFMEDKLVGDLLGLEGIAPSNRGYRMAIERRAGRPGGSHVMPKYENAPRPFQGSGIIGVHLDSNPARDQAWTMAATEARDLLPARGRIWPSWQAPAFGSASNTLNLVSDHARLARARACPVAVVACMRNEMFMLPAFLRHYRALGVEGFMIADNGSDDGTLEYLAEQPDVALFTADTPYGRSYYGVAWQEAMMSAFRTGRWSLAADADELLVWSDSTRGDLAALLAKRDFRDADGVRVFMLDTYPRGRLSDVTMAGDDPFAEAGFAEREPFLVRRGVRGPFSDALTWTSGLRHRLMPGSAASLFVAQKTPLLRYAPRMRLTDGLHYVSGLRLSGREMAFGHFKYNAAFRAKVEAEVLRGEHFNGAEEYRRYQALIAEGQAVIHDPACSVPWNASPFMRHLFDLGQAPRPVQDPAPGPALPACRSRSGPVPA